MRRTWYFLVLAAAFSGIVSGCHVERVQSRAEALFWQLESEDSDSEGPSLCPLHKIPTRFEMVPSVAGMCLQHEEYMRAKLLHFPYSYFSVSSCSCDMEFGPVPRMFCPICRRNELRWRLANGWSIDRP